MPNIIRIRDYQTEDTQALANIYYNTIHRVNIRDYSQAQVDAWAPSDSVDDYSGWLEKLEKIKPFVAVTGEKIVGFAEFEPNGHIDCFYCHHEWQGKGVGSALMQYIFEKADQQTIPRICAEVSITAKPFFERKGFNIVKEQIVTLRGVELKNFVMEKVIG
jgi:putative acetyltransferase